MRRLDKMSKEEITKFCLAPCPECKLNNSKYCDISLTCVKNKMNYLTSEIQTKSRWELCRTDEDFENMVKEADNFCSSRDYSCKGCRFEEKCGSYVGLDDAIREHCRAHPS